MASDIIVAEMEALLMVFFSMALASVSVQS